MARGSWRIIIGMVARIAEFTVRPYNFVGDSSVLRDSFLHSSVLVGLALSFE